MLPPGLRATTRLLVYSAGILLGYLVFAANPDLLVGLYLIALWTLLLSVGPPTTTEYLVWGVSGGGGVLTATLSLDSLHSSQGRLANA